MKLLQPSDYPWLTLIALEGGPCGGKSSFYKRAKEHLEKHGYCVAITPEAATLMIFGGLEPWNPHWKNSESFQAHLLEFGASLESSFIEILESMRGEKPCVLFCDRGLPGGSAYVGEQAFAAILQSIGLDLGTIMNRYSMIIHLVTAANGAEEYYTLENNQSRTETPEQARRLDELTRKAYSQHLHHRVIDNSTDFVNKIKRALEALTRKLNIPMAAEIENKWRITSFDPKILSRAECAIDITQTYLKSPDTSIERRVRRLQEGGSKPTFVYTEKVPTDILGKRQENERLISIEEYDALLQEQMPGTHSIRKTRYKFRHGNYTLELDVYHDRLKGLVTAEVEVATVEELASLKLPDFLHGRNVTGNKVYSNAVLATLSDIRELA